MPPLNGLICLSTCHKSHWPLVLYGGIHESIFLYNIAYIFKENWIQLQRHSFKTNNLCYTFFHHIDVKRLVL